MFDKILFATSGSPECDSAARVAFDMARQYGAELILFHVLGIPGKGDSSLVIDTRTGEAVDADAEYLEGVAEELRTTYAKQLAGCPKASVEIAVGVPSREILRIARAKDADMIVLCAPGQGNESGFYKRGVIGDTHRKVAKSAKCPVLTVGRPVGLVLGRVFQHRLCHGFFQGVGVGLSVRRPPWPRPWTANCTCSTAVDLNRFQSAIALTQDGIETKLAEARRRLHHDYAVQTR